VSGRNSTTSVIGGRLLTRNGNDWTKRYPSVVAAVNSLKVKSCLIDGEITVCDEKGLAVFDLLRHGSRIKPEAVLFAFDLLELDGEDLRFMPIEIRKRTSIRVPTMGEDGNWQGSCSCQKEKHPPAEHVFLRG
jgi:hypothetical protein